MSVLTSGMAARHCATRQHKRPQRAARSCFTEPMGPGRSALRHGASVGRHRLRRRGLRRGCTCGTARLHQAPWTGPCARPQAGDADSCSGARRRLGRAPGAPAGSCRAADGRRPGRRCPSRRRHWRRSCRCPTTLGLSPTGRVACPTVEVLSPARAYCWAIGCGPAWQPWQLGTCGTRPSPQHAGQ